MSDVREIPDYWRCERHPSKGAENASSGLGCLPCTVERDEAVDALIEAARAQLRSHGNAMDKCPVCRRLAAALARFGVEP